MIPIQLLMMVLLPCLPLVSAGSMDGFNNTVLKYQTWPLEDCSKIVPSDAKRCKSVINEKEACKICSKNSCTVHVAIAFPDEEEKYILNLNRTTAVVQEAAKSIQHLVPDITFEFKSLDSGCKPAIGLSQIFDVIDWCPHVIFGFTCDYTLASVGRIAKILGNYGTPLLSPSGYSFDFTSTRKVDLDDEFYHLINIGSTGYGPFSEFFHLVADKYKWNKFAVIFEKYELSELGGELACHLLVSNIVYEFSNIDTQSGDIQLLNITYEAFLKEKVSVNYAIVLTCAAHTNIRKMAIAAAKLGMMDNGEYLFFNFAPYNNAPYPDRPWYDANDTENNEIAKKAFGSFLTIYPHREAQFDKVANQSYRGSYYLDDLYEGMQIYGQSLSNMTKYRNDSGPKGCEVVQHIMGNRFSGINDEEIIMNCNGQKVTEYALVAQDEEGLSRIIGTYTSSNKTITYWNPENVVFPPDVPKCGFDMSKCPSYNKVNIAIIIMSVVIFLGLLTVVFFIYRHYKLRGEIYSEAWKIKYDEIVFLSKDRRSSIHSLLASKELDEMSLVGDTQLFADIGYYKSIRVAIKKLPEIKINLGLKQLFELKVMKDLSNDNLVKFYGACTDIPNNCLLVEYCSRGSLQDILENQQYNLDWTFRMSLTMDIVRGMCYLHNSPIKSHGSLKSSNCLVDSRFVLKISDYGLHFFRGNEKSDEADCGSYQYWKRFLWTAPELLRMGNAPPEGTQKGDVYSFAIIMQEIIMREGVFYVQDFSLEPKEIVEMVRNGPEANNGMALRPTISSENVNEPVEEITSLIQKCWSEEPHERPDFGFVKAKLRRKDDMNLVDNLLTRMEQYANNLESLVEERTKDYLEEKRKCEEVLYQLLPKSVAQQLIMGQSVTAEGFDSVTIYFSDIVGFTALSAESTPLEIVDLLNDLYGLFDSKVEQHEVYKVETIGDAYMVVSGLPERNGLKHVFEVSRLALQLMEAVKNFKIRHRPDLALKIRIGLHSGPVVAGVVGHKMPRYCLFGDTVNTAARMEQNGLPLKIHVSGATKELLEKVGEFIIEERGPVPLKGKGEVITYWLVGEKPGNTYRDAAAFQNRRPATPLPIKCRNESSHGMLVGFKRSWPEDDYSPEISANHLFEKEKTVKYLEDETEMPLLKAKKPPVGAKI